MVSVLRVHLPSEIPIVGCEVTPYLLLKRPDGSVTADDVTELDRVDGQFIRYTWYRIQSERKPPVCCVHLAELAKLQCLGCVKVKIPIVKTYHCSLNCFAAAWQHHRALHDNASSAVNDNGNEDDDIFARFNSTSGNMELSASHTTTSLSNGSSIPYPPTTQRNGETLFEVGCCKTYTPTVDDIGHVLKFECVVIDAETRSVVGSASSLLTSRVIPAPSPSPRCMISVSGIDVSGHLDLDSRSLSAGSFTVLSYNILSDSHATSEQYNYCPSWALSWTYRRQNLLREIVGYGADIICLQEVQSDHFKEFFVPELDKHGYQALFKKRTSEVFMGSTNSVDGCATFYRREKFLHMKKYEVEFNKAAQSVTEALVPSTQKRNTLSRMAQDNVALILVLEIKSINQGLEYPGNRQLICVANTRVNMPQELKDIKVWQVHTLLKGLEKIAASANIPILVCGDFDSVPGSGPHSLLAMGKIDPFHPDLAVDPLGILRPIGKLTHQLPLVSAYSSFARVPIGLGPEHKRRMDPSTNEPLFTIYTRDFIGTHDYIFYSADSLKVESLLELLDKDNLHKDTALPSPEWSSDHIALLAEFRCKPRVRR